MQVRTFGYSKVSDTRKTQLAPNTDNGVESLLSLLGAEAMVMLSELSVLLTVLEAHWVFLVSETLLYQSSSRSRFVLSRNIDPRLQFAMRASCAFDLDRACACVPSCDSSRA